MLLGFWRFPSQFANVLVVNNRWGLCYYHVGELAKPSPVGTANATADAVGSLGPVDHRVGPTSLQATSKTYYLNNRNT